MSVTVMIFCTYAGIMLGVNAHLTLKELEQKFDTLEGNVESLEGNLESLMEESSNMKNQLEYGGKNFQTVSLSTSLPLRDHDYLKLQFLGAKNAWLGCAGSVCGLATCPSSNDNYRYFDTRCYGEDFQIIGEGTRHSPIKCGQRIRLNYLYEHNTWMSCSSGYRCGKATCPGTTAQGTNFNNNRCYGEIFRIYTRGKTDGQTIHNGDVVMLYYPHGCKYVSIQGENLGDANNLNFCPGVAPSAYLSYGICSKNAFRIYRKP